MSSSPGLCRASQTLTERVRQIPSRLLAALLVCASHIAQSQGTPVPARTVPLLLPSAIAYDTSGNLYVAETQRHTIRKIDTLGNITTVAGDGTEGFSGDGGPATSAQLSSPQGLAIDSTGTLYLADSGNHRIRRIDAASKVIQTVAGDGRAAFAGDGGPATGASLSRPTSLAIDASGTNLFISDTTKPPHPAR